MLFHHAQKTLGDNDVEPVADLNPYSLITSFVFLSVNVAVSKEATLLLSNPPLIDSPSFLETIMSPQVFVVP